MGQTLAKQIELSGRWRCPPFEQLGPDVTPPPKHPFREKKY